MEEVFIHQYTEKWREELTLHKGRLKLNFQTAFFII
jgi:hypothetical protein